MSRTSLGLLIALGLVVASSTAFAVDDPGPPDAAPPPANAGTTTTTTTVVQPATQSATVYTPYGLPAPGKSLESHLESSSRMSTDSTHSTDGFDLDQPSGGGGVTLHGDPNSAGVMTATGPRSASEHVVRRGDTLWDISAYYHRTPYDWPRIWSFNPNIQNPHWIYPGDHVRLRKPSEEADDRPAVVMGLRSPSVSRQTVFLRDEGFLDDAKKDQWGSISGSPEDVMLLTEGDVIYLEMKKDQNPQVGEELTVFHDIRPAPKGKGAVVRILGTARVDTFDPNTRIARATLTESLDPVERGMAVGPVGRRFDVVPPVRNSAEKVAHIIASVYPREFHGRDQVVFLDVGSEDGIVAGNRFFVLRRGDPWRAGLAGAGDLSDQSIKMNSKLGVDTESVHGTNRDKDYPDEIVGELRVLRVREHTATCLVTASKKELTEGDVAIARKGY